MTDGAPLRFDIDALLRLAGDTAFARGLAYHQDGQVEILGSEPGRVLARVSGSEDYRSMLTGAGADIDGECSCPAFADRGFCKHLVATALAANEVVTDGEAAGERALDRIRRHLAAKGIDSLVEMIVDLAERDAVLFRALDMAAASAADNDDTVFARFRGAIDDATRTGGYLHYREVAGWADAVEMVLDRIAELATDGRGTMALRLIDHAFSRIEEAIGEIDDSDDHGGGLLERAQGIHFAACRAVRPDPVALAGGLYDREVAGMWDTFHGAAAKYAEVLGEAGLAEFRRRAAIAWEEIPPLAAGRRATDDFSTDRSRLAAIMDFFAERDGDVDARIAIRAHDLSSPWRYLELARFCLSQGRDADALRHAEDGIWLFEDEPPDERLVTFVADLHLVAGRRGDAEAVLWRAFEKRPSLDLYQRLRPLGADAARDHAVAILRARLAASGPKTRWSSPADLLIRVLMAEAMYAPAWEAVRLHGASEGLRETLAKASEASHPGEALAVYAARVDALVAAGGNGNYAEACRLVARMAGLREPSEQSAYVAALRLRFKPKRNFMKLLGP